MDLYAYRSETYNKSKFKSVLPKLGYNKLNFNNFKELL